MIQRERERERERGERKRERYVCRKLFILLKELVFLDKRKKRTLILFM